MATGEHKRATERANLMRQAAALLRQQDRLLKEGGVESMTLACAVCAWDLESQADVMENERDELFECENTPVYGIKVK